MAITLLGVALAVGATTLLDLSGYALLSALPLIPLFFLFWWLSRLSRREIGLTGGRPSAYALAIVRPALVIGILAWLAYSAGAMDLSSFDAGKAARNIAIMAGGTFVMAIITEEGFFRGWLWGALRRQDATPMTILVASSLAFVLWHVPFVFVSNEFHFEAAHIPLFFANATLLGLIWGMLRLGSGSVLVPSADHGLWNGLTYVLFGVGSGTGALGINDVGTYGPEVGLYAIALNSACLALLGWMYRDQLAGRKTAEAGI